MATDFMYSNFPADPPVIDDRGKAWEINTTNLGSATVANWLVCAKGFSHPLWWWYQIACIHLRPVKDVPPADVHKEGATHELVFLALDPSCPLPDLHDWHNAIILEPIDLAHQFTVRSDKQARQLTQKVVQHICQGNSPDSDYRQSWEDIVDRTAEHICYGTHPSLN